MMLNGTMSFTLFKTILVCPEGKSYYHLETILPLYSMSSSISPSHQHQPEGHDVIGWMSYVSDGFDSRHFAGPNDMLIGWVRTY